MITDNSIKEEYSFTKIANIEKLTDVFEKFSNATGYTVGIVDNKTLDVIVKTGWHDICENFHRADEKACEICKTSNKSLFDNLDKEKAFDIIKCDHGLYDSATPIIIEGNHVANIVTGQFLLEKPDRKRF